MGQSDETGESGCGGGGGGGGVAAGCRQQQRQQQQQVHVAQKSSEILEFLELGFSILILRDDFHSNHTIRGRFSSSTAPNP